MKPFFQVLSLCGLLLAAAAAPAQWSTAYLSQARSGMAATSAGGKVFFAGGSSGGGYVSTVDIYDVASNVWTTANLSQARSSLAATSAGGKVFFGGGFSFNGYSAVVDIYDVASNTWTTASLSQARYGLSAVSAGGKVFFAGGTRSAAAGSASTSAVVDIYDLATGTWSAASLWQARDRIAVTSVGSKVFFGGGYDGSGYASVVDVYDLATGTWTWMPTGLSQARVTSAVSVGGKAFFGGGGGYSLNFSIVDVYNPASNIWTSANLSQARSNLAATSAGNRAFFGGGYNGGPSKTVDLYNAATNAWTTTLLSQARSQLVATSAGGKVFFAGGLTADNYPTGLVDIYTLGQATVITQQPTPAALSACAGGTVSSSLTATGEGTLGFQWYKKGSPDVALPAQTTATLTLSNLQPGDAGMYYCVVSGEAETVSSNDVTVNVAPPNFSTPSVNGAPVCGGESVTLTFTASCFPAETFFTAQLSDASGSFANPLSLGLVAPGSNPLLIPNGTAGGSGYRLRVGSSAGPGSAPSAAFTVKAPAFDTTPTVSGAPVCAGGSVTLSFTTACFPAGTTFSAQLSDASGSFVGATSLGTVSPGLNPILIPIGTEGGTGYRLRVLSSTEALSAGSAPFTIDAPGLSTPNVTHAPVCVGEQVLVSFSATCFPAGTIFTAQLSNALGSFANPIGLGSVAPGTNPLTIPSGLAGGTGYRLRVLSSTGLTSADSAPFTVSALGFNGIPTVSGAPLCAGQSLTLSFSLGACGFPAGATFGAQLSDAVGNFAGAVSLGPVAPGSTVLTVPAGLPGGTGYKIRILAVNPILLSTPTAAFTINEPGFVGKPMLSGTPVCAGQSVQLQFAVSCFPGGTTFSAELSDASGSFASPVALGAVVPGGTSLSIPTGSPAGSGYRVRVVSSGGLKSEPSADFQVKALNLTKPNVSGTPVCAGQGVVVTFSLEFECGTPPGNEFTAELSDADGKFLAPVLLGSVAPGNNPRLIPAGTPAGLGYRIRIRASNPALTSAPSDPFEVKVPGFPAIPTLSQGTACAGSNLVVGFVIGCPFPAGTSFSAQLSDKAGSFAAPLSLGSVSPGISSSVALPSGTAAGTGYRVRILSSTGLFSAPSAAFEVKVPFFSSTPTVSGAPVCAGKTVTLAFTVGTCPFGAGTSFTAQLSDGAGSFASPLSLGGVTPGSNALTLPANLPEGSGYRLRVQASAPGLTSAPSAAFSVLKPGFGALVQVSNVPVCPKASVAVTFSTIAPCAFGIGNVFKAQLSNASGSFASPVVLGNVGANGGNVTIPAGTPAGNGYKIRIVSSNPALTSVPSAAFKVNQCINREVAPAESGLRVVVSPNPATDGRLRIQISGAEGQHLNVELFNGTGLPLRQQAVERAGETQVLDWDIVAQPAGLYLVRVSGERAAKTVKVLR